MDRRARLLHGPRAGRLRAAAGVDAHRPERDRRGQQLGLRAGDRDAAEQLRRGRLRRRGRHKRQRVRDQLRLLQHAPGRDNVQHGTPADVRLHGHLGPLGAQRPPAALQPGARKRNAAVPAGGSRASEAVHSRGLHGAWRAAL
ncbi:PP262 [Orf virus]|uniref:PP262 n=1 Tax=Orf virus TaxID=10258 RepID=F1AXF8_ORFV|nr:PP262 [Orf virus]